MPRTAARLLGAITAGALAVPLVITSPAAAQATPVITRTVTVAGTGEDGYSGDGQRATEARINGKGAITVGPDGTLYLVDEDVRRIRAVNAQGVIDTVPGSRALRSPANDSPTVNGMKFSPSDGPMAVTAAKDGTLYVAGTRTVRRLGRDGVSTALAAFREVTDAIPNGIAVDDAGNTYVNGDNLIFKIDPAGKLTRIGGGGRLEGQDANGKPATEARLSPNMAVDSRGTVYVVSSRETYKRDQAASLYKIDSAGILHTVAGGGQAGFSGDGGPAVKARVSAELGAVAVDAKDNVYLLDRGNGVVRVIGADGVIGTIAPALPNASAVTHLAAGPNGEIYLREGARVRKLVRENLPTAPARQATYPARFPQDAPGTVHTIAGSGQEERTNLQPRQPDQGLRIAVSPDGARYYVDTGAHRVMKVAPDGTSSVFAGAGEPGFRGDGGDAARAQLSSPRGLAVGPDGSVYIADTGNKRLRKVDPTGVISTVAGNGGAGGKGGYFGEKITVRGDGGPAIAATVTPRDVAVGPDGSLYIAEAENSRVSKVDPNGMISSFAGAGERWMNEADGHRAAESDFYAPRAVAVGRDGSVYVLDGDSRGNWPAVRMVDPRGIVRTVAGNSYHDEKEAGFGGDGGPAVKAELNNPHDIAVGPDGTLYIGDTYNARVRAVNPAGVITTVAGTGQRADSGDGGPAAASGLREPQAVDVDAKGVLHVITLPGDRIRAIDHGTITTTATLLRRAAPGWGFTGRPATEAGLTPTSVAVDHDGRLLIGDQTTGIYTTETNGTLVSAHEPTVGASDIAVAPDGARYLASTTGGVTRVDPGGGQPYLVAGGGPGNKGEPELVEPGKPATLASFGRIADLAVSPNGRLYVAGAKGVYRLEHDGTLATVHTGLVRGIAVDAEERFYLADSARVYRVDAAGVQTAVAGSGEQRDEDEDNGDGGDATDAWLDSPADVAVDSAGNVYIATDEGIRRVDADGTIITVANIPPSGSYPSTSGELTLDRHGDLYYIDAQRNQVKVVVQPGRIATPFDWAPVIWIAGGALALAIVGLVGLRWWRRRPKPEEA
ncbi:NHL repeat-containing protein [Herbihabitans rhizosphaerae]|uniref:NHL repeat-containing protein n=1 Tax=Herbihabitans rhizosphaerae TaxID=1872711 RepID=A0A4Q7L5D4_9PSEU|nr:hypothetical protein [Herbihabitans rhizosphaerae]RZS44484.1 NHL repeat-containing protein [Herbihabitans rhizosphaerae]